MLHIQCTLESVVLVGNHVKQTVYVVVQHIYSVCISKKTKQKKTTLSITVNFLDQKIFQIHMA